MANKSHSPNTVFIALAIITSMLVVRSVLLASVPLYDTTEARYSEIARIMYETKNWITPQIDYDQPFWGKPPLHTWMSAVSFVTFGVSALSARLPHFVCGLLVLFLIYRFAKQDKNCSVALTSVLVLSTSVGFIVAMGMVMTDIALLFSTTLAMLSFWNAYHHTDKALYGNLFFISLGLGMLIKGPVAVVIVGIALCCWCIYTKQLSKALAALPWLSGIGCFLLVTLPWYVLAEYSTPGFLEYFIVGEHFQRFLVSGWQGDLYGNAHDKPRGMIWLYWLIAAFPWSLLLIGKWLSALLGKTSMQPLRHSDDLKPYLVCWMLAPLILFTFAGNILIAYVLPGFAALALLVGLSFKLTKRILLVASVSLALLLSLAFAERSGLVEKTSEVELLHNHFTQYSEHPLYYWQKRPFSARFYSNGLAQVVAHYPQLLALANSGNGVFIAAEHKYFTQLSTELTKVCIEKQRTAERFLLFCRGST